MFNCPLSHIILHCNIAPILIPVGFPVTPVCFYLQLTVSVFLQVWGPPLPPLWPQKWGAAPRSSSLRRIPRPRGPQRGQGGPRRTGTARVPPAAALAPSGPPGCPCSPAPARGRGCEAPGAAQARTVRVRRAARSSTWVRESRERERGVHTQRQVYTHRDTHCTEIYIHTHTDTGEQRRAIPGYEGDINTDTCRLSHNPGDALTHRHTLRNPHFSLFFLSML